MLMEELNSIETIIKKMFLKVNSNCVSISNDFFPMSACSLQINSTFFSMLFSEKIKYEQHLTE